MRDVQWRGKITAKRVIVTGDFRSEENIRLRLSHIHLEREKKRRTKKKEENQTPSTIKGRGELLVSL